MDSVGHTSLNVTRPHTNCTHKCTPTHPHTKYKGGHTQSHTHPTLHTYTHHTTRTHHTYTHTHPTRQPTILCEHYVCGLTYSQGTCGGSGRGLWTRRNGWQGSYSWRLLLGCQVWSPHSIIVGLEMPTFMILLIQIAIQIPIQIGSSVNTLTQFLVYFRYQTLPMRRSGTETIPSHGWVTHFWMWVDLS